MNSKQRRADQRLWKYTVSANSLRSHDDCQHMFDWCVATFGNPANIRHAGRRWRETHYLLPQFFGVETYINGYGGVLQFTNNKDAALFALKWT